MTPINLPLPRNVKPPSTGRAHGRSHELVVVVGERGGSDQSALDSDGQALSQDAVATLDHLTPMDVHAAPPARWDLQIRSHVFAGTSGRRCPLLVLPERHYMMAEHRLRESGERSVGSRYGTTSARSERGAPGHFTTHVSSLEPANLERHSSPGRL